MKDYPSFNSVNEKHLGKECIAFSKIDGSQLRFCWNRKTGWQFGTRHRTITPNEPIFGEGYTIFMEKYGDKLTKLLIDNNLFKRLEEYTAFCEFFGENSFAGQHEQSDKKDLILFDIEVYKQGFLIPNEFLNIFESVEIPKIIYKGKLTSEFINTVIEDLTNREGVVVKGVNEGKNPRHSLWMGKIKTKWWLDKLKEKAAIDNYFKTIMDSEK